MLPDFGTSLAMTRFLGAPELPQIVTTFIADKQDLASMAQTCQALKEVALDALWSDLNTLKPLLLLFSPLKDQAGVWEFSNPHISIQRWNVYARYNSRVKTIKDVLGDSGLSFGPSIFMAIGQTRPVSLPLLPNLRSLSVTVTAEGFMSHIPFLGHSLLKLALRIRSNSAGLRFACQEILARAPLIQVVRMATRIKEDDTREALVELFQGLQEIKEIRVSSCFLTPATLTALSQVQSLQTIRVFRLPVGVPDPRPFQPLSFPNLLYLHLGLSLEAMLPLMADPNWAPQLRRLDMESKNTTEDHLEAFSVALAQSAPSITTLVLDLIVTSHGSRQQSSALTFQALRPLLGCHQISRFFIRHQSYILLESKELECILRAWPGLVSFYYCLDAEETTAVPEDFGFCVDILLLFARLCPQIESLGIRFKNHSSQNWQAGLRLQKLRQLHYGSQSLKGPKDLALILACVCNSSLTFGYGKYIYDLNRPGPSSYDIVLSGDQETHDRFLAYWVIQRRFAAEAAGVMQELKREFMEKDTAHHQRLLELQEKFEDERRKRQELEKELDELRGCADVGGSSGMVLEETIE